MQSQLNGAVRTPLITDIHVYPPSQQSTALQSAVEVVQQQTRVRIAPLVALLCSVALVGSFLAVTGRGAFFDEAIYMVAGKTLLFRAENWNFETWFVGSPFAFPMIAGLVQALGGDLVATRLVNVAILLVAVWAAHNFIVALGLGTRAALLGAASFGLAGPVLFTGSFAVYDPLALSLTAVSLWLIAKGTADRRPRPGYLLAAGLALGLAIIAKYVVIATAPVILALAAVRLLPENGGLSLRPRFWGRCVLGVLVFAVPAAIVVGAYAFTFWLQLKMVLSYAGGHTTNYGATGPAILVTIVAYVGTAWLVGLYGLEKLRGDRKLFLLGLTLFAGSLVMPLYHLWKVDPLALFKQMTWTLLFLAPLVGVALARLRPRPFAAVAVALLLVSLFNVATLRGFYADTKPASDWLKANVSPYEDPILADNAWPFRHALNETFDGKEWRLVDQWWWQSQKATPELWRSLISQGAFGYVVFERGGAFSGEGSVFDSSVINAVEQSGQYRLIKTFRSRVTWGNSILPPPFRGELQPYGVVQTEIWERIW